MQLSFVTTAKNLSDREVTMVLAERIPVSENSEIRVSGVKITPNAKPDAQGIVRWTITLKPRQELQFRVSYQVDYPPSLIFDVKRKRRMRPKSPSPSRDSPYEFEDRIHDLEMQL